MGRDIAISLIHMLRIICLHVQCQECVGTWGEWIVDQITVGISKKCRFFFLFRLLNGETGRAIQILGPGKETEQQPNLCV